MAPRGTAVGRWLEATMAELQFPELLAAIRATSRAGHKLTLLAGEARAGKTFWLKRVATSLELPLINLGLLVSQRLLGRTRQQRQLQAATVAAGVIDEHLTSGLCLDDTELLFDSALRLNPLAFLQDISRNRLLVATWNGVVTGGALRYGHTGHPDYFSEPVNGCPVVSVARETLQLHLTP